MMSITGLFLLIFIAVHLTLNLFLIFDDTGALFNQGGAFHGNQSCHQNYGAHFSIRFYCPYSLVNCAYHPKHESTAGELQ